MTWQHWLKGLAGAVIGGCATAGAMTMIDADKFNFHEGLASLAKLLFIAGFINACAYLKQSPVPPDKI